MMSIVEVAGIWWNWGDGWELMSSGKGSAGLSEDLRRFGNKFKTNRELGYKDVCCACKTRKTL